MIDIHFDSLCSYVIIPLLFCYWFFEVHYFLRFLSCAFIAKFFKKKIGILDRTTIWGICLTTDVDTLLFHMNNGRYLREVDFARADFYIRSGLWQAIKANKGSVAQICTNIRYRRFIKPLTVYRIESKVVYWDDRTIFMEHRFLTNGGEFVNAIVMSRQRLINCNSDSIINSLVKRIGENVVVPSDLSGAAVDASESPTTATSAPDESGGKLYHGNGIFKKPDIPLEYAKWVECNDISSALLRSHI